MFWMRNKKNIFGTHSKLKVLSFLLFMFRVCHVFLSVHCSLVETCWKSADLLTLLLSVLLCFAIFPCGVLGQVWSYKVSF